MIDTDRDRMPALLNARVQVISLYSDRVLGYGLVRRGYWGDNPDAGHFEVESADGTVWLALWRDVRRCYANVTRIPFPDPDVNYSPRYGSGGVFHTDGTRDERYVVDLEFCGYASQRYTARWRTGANGIGDWIGQHPTATEAWEDARTHQWKRQMAPSDGEGAK